MKLTGKQYQQLIKALLSAFPSQPKLAQMIRFKLEENLNAIALGDDLTDIAYKLLVAAEAGGWTSQLIVAARESQPGNSELFAFSQQFGLVPGKTPSRREIEAIIRKTNSFLDVNLWRERLGKIEAQVCRIEIDTSQGTIYGTGFLLAPDVLITNYHVMEQVILAKDGIAAKDVILRFDYKRLADGATLNQGTEYHLAEDWLIDNSPNVAKNMPSQVDRLDYALLRIDGSPGTKPIGGKVDPEAPQRGWIEMPTKTHNFKKNEPLFILQHPNAEPLKLAFDTDAIIGVNEDNTMVTYKTNTLGGSSGSPCFNSNWELVALHHSRDPDFSKEPDYNAGTPFSAILALLEERGLKHILGEQPL